MLHDAKVEIEITQAIGTMYFDQSRCAANTHDEQPITVCTRASRGAMGESSPATSKRRKRIVGRPGASRISRDRSSFSLTEDLARARDILSFRVTLRLVAARNYGEIAFACVGVSKSRTLIPRSASLSCVKDPRFKHCNREFLAAFSFRRILIV